MTTRPVNLSLTAAQLPDQPRSHKHVRVHFQNEEQISECAARLLATMFPHQGSFASTGKPPLRPGLKKADDPGFLNAGAGQDVVTDISFFIRGLPSPIAHTILDALMGNSTGINAFLGYASFLKASKMAQACKAVGWRDGEISARFNQARSVVQCVGGATFFGVRALTLASFIKGTDASGPTVPTLLGRVTFVVSTIGTVLWGIFYALLVGMCAKDLSNIAEFRAEWESVKINPDKDGEMNDPQRLASYVAFFEKWSGMKEEIETEVYRNNSDAELRAAALTNCAEVLKSFFDEGELPKVNEEGRQALIRDILKALNPEGETDQILIELGAEWKVAQLKAKRQLQLATVTGGECVSAFEALASRLEDATTKLRSYQVRENLREASFSELVRRGDPVAFAKAKELVIQTQAKKAPLKEGERAVQHEAHEFIVQKMESALSTNKWLNVGYAIACVIGVLATIAGLLGTFGVAIFTAPIWAPIITVAFLVVVAMMIVLDGYCLNETLKTATPGTFDKKLLTISTVIGLLSMVATIVVVSVLSLGIVPLITAIVIGVLWIGVNAKTWYQIVHNERKVAPVTVRDEALAQAKKDAEEREKLEHKLGQLALGHFVNRAYFPSVVTATA